MNMKCVVCAVLLLPFGVSAQWTAPSAPAALVPERSAIRASVTDPVGDNFNPGPDITGFSATSNSVNMTLVLTFAGAILPPPGGAAVNVAVGGILIDVDQNGASGAASNLVTTFCPMPPAGFGPEFQIDLFSYNAVLQTAPILPLPAGAPVGNAQVTYGANTITVVVPNATIADDGLANLNAVIGNTAAPTDCVPDGAVLFSGQPATPTPVPSTSAWGLALITLLIAIFTIAFGRRVKAQRTV